MRNLSLILIFLAFCASAYAEETNTENDKLTFTSTITGIGQGLTVFADPDEFYEFIPSKSIVLIPPDGTYNPGFADTAKSLAENRKCRLNAKYFKPVRKELEAAWVGKKITTVLDSEDQIIWFGPNMNAVIQGEHKFDDASTIESRLDKRSFIVRGTATQNWPDEWFKCRKK